MCTSLSSCKQEPVNVLEGKESFGTIVYGFWPFTVIAKFSVLDVCGDLGVLAAPVAKLVWY